MKKLKGLSLILSLAVILSLFNFSVYADENTVTAYITISKYGEIVKDKNGDYVAEKPVTLSDKESYNLDDVFYKAHELYYEGGAEAGYSSYTHQSYGLSAGKIWGDTSGNFMYLMNLGSISPWNLSQEVSDGDYIDLFVLTQDYEGYSYFDEYTKNIEGDTAELTLYESYYGENWETLFKPCENATILINGAETDIVTDENGKCSLTLDKSGKYLISAKKTKTVKNPINEEERTAVAITAPVCTAYAEVPDTSAVIHNIVNKSIEEDISQDDQMYWLLADISEYFKIYPDRKNILSSEDKDNCFEKIVTAAEAAIEKAENEIDETQISLANPLAKSIIALRAMDYDAENVYNGNGDKVDIVGILKERIENACNDVTNIYTLPYVMLAMKEYLTAEQMSVLINAALVQKESWQDTTWGIDGATPMMRALAPYYDENDDVKTALNETVELIKAAQGDSGAISAPWGGYSAASTGLAIAGLSEMGINPETVKNNGKNLIQGLMSLATENLDGFLSSSYDTEQGLRGLIAWKLAKPFKEEENNEQNGESGHSGNSSNVNDDNTKISVTVKIMTHNASECNNSYTYRYNSANYTELVSETAEFDKNATVYDATLKVLSDNNISYEDRSGYFAEIGGFSELDHGTNSGWQYMVNGVHQDVGCKSVTLLPNSTILWYYTDDYTLEKGSERYSKTGSLTVKQEENSEENAKEESANSGQNQNTFTENTFSDIKSSDWHYSAVKYVYENNLMQGTGNGFEPDSKMTRAMLVSVLFRLNGGEKSEKNVAFNDIEDGKWYTDSVLWAASIGIVSGVGDNNFAPDSEITREQMAVILYNFARYKNQMNLQSENEEMAEFEDFGEVSDYAKDAMSWANAQGFISGESENTLNPQNTATRAQIASLLMRYCEAGKY